MTVTCARLTTDQDWERLQASFEGARPAIGAVRGILSRARELGAVSVAVEEDYLDRDFSSEFAAFYSGLFKRFSKLCRRYHFFAVDVTDVLNEADPQKILESLTALSEQGKYVGYAVARPVPHAPLGRVVLAPPQSSPNTKTDLLVRSSFVAHLLGASLKVTGVPFTQQDTRIGACAQAAIWMAARHFHSKHPGSPRVSTVDITEAASKPIDHMLSLALPAGSGGLTVEHMVRALRAIDREPLLYHGKYDPLTMTTTWPPSIRPVDVIDRYVDSGVPVILGLAPWAGQEELHAVLAVGHTLQSIDPAKVLPPNPTRAEFARFILVNDDQRGVALRVGVSANDGSSETPYNASNIVFIIVPLPGKVFTPAESAEMLAWDFLRRVVSEWPNLKAAYATQIGQSVTATDSFVASLTANEVIARTYLTYGWRYKQRIIRNTCSSTLKDSVFRQDFPRFVWVTEFGTRATFNQLDETAVQVLAHVVVDATSSRFWEGRCICHVPGFVWRWFPNPANPFGDYINSITPIPDDTVYRMKIRGSFPG